MKVLKLWLLRKLNQPKLYAMSSKGLATEDIVQMKYNEAEAYGFSMDEYGKLKTYLKNHKMKTEPSAINTSPVSAGDGLSTGGKMNQISNKMSAPAYQKPQVVVVQESENLFGPCCLGFLFATLFTPFGGFCLAPCISGTRKRGAIFLGCTISAFFSGIVFFIISAVVKSNMQDVVCNSPRYTGYYGFYINGSYVSCNNYYQNTIIGPLQTVGGIFIGIGIILSAIAGYLYWSGKYSIQSPRVEPVMYQNV
jgi:hypothetical protein